MKKGEIYEGFVQKVSFPNKGVVDADGTRVIVKNVMPGQRILFRVTKKRQNHFEGRLLKVLEKSELETTEPLCSQFPDCGGCMYQTMTYEAQLKMKAEQVKELLSGVLEAGQSEGIGKTETGQSEDNEKTGTGGGIGQVFRGILASPQQTGYRNKMEYTFGDACKGGPLTLGLHKKGSNFDILPAVDCILVHDDMNRIVSCVLEYCREQKLPYYHRMSHEGFLRHLLVRRAAATGQILAAIVTTTQQRHDFTELKKRILALPLAGSLSVFLHMENDSVADVVRSEHTEILYSRDYEEASPESEALKSRGTRTDSPDQSSGAEREALPDGTEIEEELLGLKFRISPFSFFQTNTKGAEILYQTARDMIGNIDGAVVFDLYSGTGTIGQVLAPAAKKVIGVEIVEEAVEAARENAARNHLANCTFLCGDVLKVLPEISETPDYLILDPPREGIHPRALEQIIAYNAARIVYISCKPTSLARDLAAFLAGGYEVKEIRCVDLFPGTVHVETVVLLSRNT